MRITEFKFSHNLAKLVINKTVFTIKQRIMGAILSQRRATV